MPTKVSLTYRKPNNYAGAKRAPLPTPSIEGGRGEGVPPPVAPGPEESEVQMACECCQTSHRFSLDSIHALVAGLGYQQKQALYDSLAAALRDASPADRELDMWASSLYNALVAALGGKGGGVPGPGVIRALCAPRKAWAPVEGFMSANGFTGLKVAERQAVYHLLARLLVERGQAIARRAGIPLGPKLLAHNTGDIAAIVDQAFPGYGASALELVARRMFSGAGGQDA